MGIKSGDEFKGILRKIHEQGLIVLMSYCVPFPRYGRVYDDGVAVPYDEWQAIKGLWREQEYIESVFIGNNVERFRALDWRSDYLVKERIQMDIDYEYEFGLQTRYTLTDEAIRLIGADEW